MKNPTRFLPLTYLVLIGAVLVGSIDAQSSGLVLSTQAEVKADLELVPCSDGKRLNAVKELFKRQGAEESEVSTDDFGGVRNLVVKKKGKSDEIVIVGAHYDKVDVGCGAIDNWSGIVILADIYRTMRRLETQKTYLFVAFGKEEPGLIGSKAMASAIENDKLDNYCAMVNFDSFGFTYPQALGNISDASLKELARKTSDELKIPFGEANILNAGSDSASFRSRKIPAITLHGVSNNWTKFLHTPEDKFSNVNAESVYIGYRHGLAFLAKVDQAACDAFRK